jgi:anionic cell wall polymer biosynthesis LytR-Cps2A-Psr (LCP) family protein
MKSTEPVVGKLKSAGTQVVNGTHATAYARIRYTKGGDFKRAERQRIVINKIFEKAKNL